MLIRLLQSQINTKSNFCIVYCMSRFQRVKDPTEQAQTSSRKEQVGSCMGRSTKEQIFNMRVLMEKYQQHQQDLYHVFTDFRKALDRVWPTALWTTMNKYNISANLIIIIIKNLYDKAASAVLFSGSTGDWFRTTIGVRNVYFHQH